MQMRPLLAASMVIILRTNIANQAVLGVRIIIQPLLTPRQAPEPCSQPLRSLVTVVVLAKLRPVLPVAGIQIPILTPVVRHFLVLVRVVNF